MKITYNQEIADKIKSIKAEIKEQKKKENLLPNYIRNCHKFLICPNCGKDLEQWETYIEGVFGTTNYGIKCTSCNYKETTHSRTDYDN